MTIIKDILALYWATVLWFRMKSPKHRQHLFDGMPRYLIEDCATDSYEPKDPDAKALLSQVRFWARKYIKENP